MKRYKKTIQNINLNKDNNINKNSYKNNNIDRKKQNK